MLRFTPDVRIGYFDQRAGLVFHYASVWSLGAHVDVEVSCPNISMHGAVWQHPYDLAWNIRTDGDQPADLKSLARYLANRLPAGYDVVLESDHVHVEFDMRRKV